ncbi:MAG: nucleotide-binding domain containing protein, partial [Gammaproteobacteria bacterium]|nr:nucleotide-binding domain containing protein [Gammaproteobacteria bacterium]
GLPPQPVPAEEMKAYVRKGKSGAVLVGSHVKKTTEQLQQLLQQPGVKGIEVDVSKIAKQRADLLASIVSTVEVMHAQNITPVIYTSRTELQFDNQQARLAFGEKVSQFLMDVVRNLPATIGFLISKGGITSNDVLSDGLALKTSRVVGQILAGCSVVKCPEDHPQYPDLPVVIFPGNVGDENALATVYQRLVS